MGDSLRFGIVPVHDDGATRDAFDAICAALGEILGCSVVSHRAGSPGELASASVDLAWASPTLALTEMQAAVPVVCSVRQGVAHYHGVLFVARGSDIVSLLDLDGSRAAWVAKSSSSGYIFPRVALAGNGIDPESLFFEEHFLGSHGAVADAVLSGRADVGATFAVFEGGNASARLVSAGFLDPDRPARVLLATPPIPSDLVVASRELHRELGPVLEDALRALPHIVPDAVQRVFNADELAVVDPRSLGELKRQLADARALGVL